MFKDLGSVYEQKTPFRKRHPVMAGFGMAGLGVLAVDAIDYLLYLIGGTKLMNALGIIPIGVGLLFFLKGYMMIRYPAR